jgi:N4-(beta-N-acetylglucosaminyl)-L-asparaginase
MQEDTTSVIRGFMDRRDFLATAALGSLAIGIDAEALQKPGAESSPKTPALGAPKQPVIICRPSEHPAIDEAHKMLLDGSDTLDACIHVGKAQEDDPNDDSVGLGGLPNAEGVVELDASVMHGPTRRAGAVGGVHDIKNVALLAKGVMEHTGHVMLAGKGATKFGFALGFPKEDLLTDRSRKIWLLWKEFHSDQDWWGPGLADPKWKPPANPGAGISDLRFGNQSLAPSEARASHIIAKLEERAADLGIAPEHRRLAALRVLYPPTGTINISAVNTKGEMSGCTTTSGLAWKIPGRLGDSPIIGAGCYCDQDIGAAGATGSGEENIKVAGGHTIVENMRLGMAPLEAGLDALRRIARNYNNDMAKLRYVDMVYYILRKDGAYASVALWSGHADRPHRFMVHDGEKRFEKCAFLFEGVAYDWPPIPKL